MGLILFCKSRGVEDCDIKNSVVQVDNDWHKLWCSNAFCETVVHRISSTSITVAAAGVSESERQTTAPVCASFTLCCDNESFIL